MRIILSTRNPGKLAEMRSLLADLPIELISAAEIPGAPEADEPFDTLEENAIQKATLLFEHTGLPGIADDTGLEVDALGGQPGVRSARYAGSDANDMANRQRLLAEMEGVKDRQARFRTVAVYCDQSGVYRFDGVCPGRIGSEERGSGGFGYDPLFIPDGEVRTFAEMAHDEKNRISHRGRALRQLADFLRDRLNTSPA